MSRRTIVTIGALGAIIALAATLRLLGITFGLPAVYNPDEVAIMARSLAFAKGDLNPHNFLYPTFYFYVLFAWLGGAFAVMWLTGMVSSLSAFQAMFFTDPSAIYLAGRLLGVACGVAAVVATYRLGARIAGARADTDTNAIDSHAMAIGAIAALFLAVAPTHVRDSHYVKHDVPVTLAVVIAQLAILHLLLSRRAGAMRTDAMEAAARERARVAARATRADAPKRGAASPARAARRASRVDWPLVLAAAACGVAFSTHYYAVFLALPLALAIALRDADHTTRPKAAGDARMSGDVAPPTAAAAVGDLPRSPASRGSAARDSTWSTRIFALAWAWLLAALVCAAVFFALSPFLLLEPRTALQDIVANRQIVVDRAVEARHGAFASAGAYVRMLWSEAIGWPVLLAAVAGAAILVREQWRVALVLLAFPIAFLAFISNTVAASRYLNPVLPTLCVLAAYGLWRVAARRTTVTVLLALLCALPGFALSLRLGLFFRQDDTRTQAQRFIESTIPAGSTVLLQPYSVPLAQSRDSLREALTQHLGDPARASTKFALRLAAEPYPSPAYRTLFLGDGGLDPDKIYLSYRDLTADDAGATLAAAGVQFVVLKQYNVADPAVAPLRAWLTRHGQGLATFTPYRAEASEDARARVAPFLHNTDTPYDPALERPGPGVEVWRIGTDR